MHAFALIGSRNGPILQFPESHDTRSVVGSCSEKDLPGKWQFRANSAGLAGGGRSGK